MLSTKDGFGISGGGCEHAPRALDLAPACSPSDPAPFRADGNTLALASGTLLSVYSYEGKDGLHHVE